MLYGRLVTATGWRLDYIDTLTLHDVAPLTNYWADFPPVHELVRMQVEFEKPLTMEEKQDQGAMDPREFLAHFKSTQGKVDG